METEPAPRVAILLWEAKGFVSSLIRWQTRSRYSHAAIMIDDLVWESREFRGVGRRFLASVLREAEKKGDKVWLRAITPGAVDLDEVRAWLNEQVGKGYDYLSVLRFVSRRQAKRKNSGAWFCSEFAFVAARKLGLELLHDIEPWAVSPALLGVSPVPSSPPVLITSS